MAKYMIQGGYTAETWGRMIKSPEDREAAIRRLCESVGGKLESLYFTFGADDFVAICEMPDNVTCAAVSIATASSGALRGLRTTPLMTAQEMMEAARKAQTVSYAPPGGR